MSDREKLKALAMAATPGPWFGPRVTDQMPIGMIGVYQADEEGPIPGAIVCTVGHSDDDGVMDDAAYIAAANPTAILALLAEIGELEKALDAALQKDIGNEKLINVMRRRYGREARQWEANHEQRKQERDTLSAENERLRAEVERSEGLADRAVDVVLERADEQLGKVIAERERDRAEADKMRAVFEAAKAWHFARQPGNQAYVRFVATEDALYDAIDSTLSPKGDGRG